MLKIPIFWRNSKTIGFAFSVKSMDVENPYFWWNSKTIGCAFTAKSMDVENP